MGRNGIPNGAPVDVGRADPGTPQNRIPTNSNATLTNFE